MMRSQRVYQDKYPDLAEFISEHGWETLGVYDAAPVEHHKRLRTMNMIERVNQELKRRSKVVRIFPNPASCRFVNRERRKINRGLKILQTISCTIFRYTEYDLQNQIN